MLNPPLVRYLRVRAPTFADDAAAETWLAVVRGLPTFDGDGAGFKSWLFTIARSKVADLSRKAARTPALLVDDWAALDPVDDADVAGEVIDRAATVRAMELVARLPPDQAEIVALRVLADLDVAAVSAIVGKSPGAVRVAQHRALKKLAAFVQGAE